MTKKPTLTELKKNLRKKSQSELVDEIALLYKKLSCVKEYYQSSFFGDDSAVLKKYKKIGREVNLLQQEDHLPLKCACLWHEKRYQITRKYQVLMKESLT